MFAKVKKNEFPILLFVNDHSIHICLEAAEYCKENEIFFILPSSQLCAQACDTGFFSPMKAVCRSEVKEWQMDNIGRPFNKKEFPDICKATWQKVATFENVVNGFKRSEICPLTSDGIDSKVLNSKQGNISQAGYTAVAIECSVHSDGDQLPN